MSHLRRRCTLALAGVLLLAPAALASEIKVMTSGAFTAAYLALVPSCAEAQGDSVTTLTTTMGVGETSIPSRLERGEVVDVVIVDREALDELIRMRRSLPRSSVGLDFVGAIPAEVQRVTMYSAGVAATSTQKRRADAFIGCLASRASAAKVARSGLEPRHAVPELSPDYARLRRVGPAFRR